MLKMKWSEIKLEDLFSTRLRIKIVKVLVARKEANVSLLVKETRSNHGEVMKSIEYFKSIELVEEKCFGRIRIIRLRSENGLGRLVSEFVSAFP